MGTISKALLLGLMGKLLIVMIYAFTLVHIEVANSAVVARATTEFNELRRERMTRGCFKNAVELAHGGYVKERRWGVQLPDLIFESCIKAMERHLK